jgi:putative tryptophan/tyrosine transport system substrate-binding protein
VLVRVSAFGYTPRQPSSTEVPMRLIGLVVVLALSVVLAPLTDEAQPAGKVYRIGFLRAGQPPKTFVEAFQQGLRARGYIEGRNVVIEYRFTDGSFDELPRLAAELVRFNVDVILASAAPSAFAARSATTKVPIVFVGVYDPVEIGLMTSVARPGGNVTGLSQNSADFGGKRLELIKELVPKLRRVAILWHPANLTNLAQKKGVEAAARTVGVDTKSVPVQDPNHFGSAFEDARGVDALMQMDDPFFTTHFRQLAELAVRSRLPAICGIREYVDAGGLMSYGADYPDLYRRAATYVDKILKGAKPADLPIEQPSKFELVINRKTAKALGLTIPQTLLLQANQIIE